MIKKIVIFGVGRLGKLAYHYYKNLREIVCFIDNKEALWGTNFEGIPIYSPEILFGFDLREVRIVIAVKNKWEKIQEQLYTSYQISDSILFQISEDYLDYMHQETTFDCTGHETIICYSGGLGNQMFQYALARCFMKSNNNVTGDENGYDLWHEGKFQLSNVFPKASVKKCNPVLKAYYEKVLNCEYREDIAGKVDYLEANMHILKESRGVFRGYWQNYKYPEIVRGELLSDFEFQHKNDDYFNELKEYISMQNTVSVHIRRGDYLKSCELYGGICTDEYYNKAINYISQQVENAVFCFFSDDMKWVVEKYKGLKNAKFVNSDMFEDYEDWYDMCLMSHCRHNIIANSTFSWWGAWLNTNPNKIVIAPSKWINGCEMRDICCNEWVKI